MRLRVLLPFMLAACSPAGAPKNRDAGTTADSDLGVEEGPADLARDSAPPRDMTAVLTFAGLQSAKASPNAIQLSWPAASDPLTPADRITYLVYQSTTSGGQDLSTPTYTVTGGQVRLTLSKLPKSTTYYFIVRARSAAGKVDDNRVEVSATTPDIADEQAPTFAGAATADPLLSSGINLSWAAATDNHAPVGEIIYQVYQATAAGAQDLSKPTFRTSPGTTGLFIGDLAPSTTYYFVVRALDLAGNLDANTMEITGTTKAVSFAAELAPTVLSRCQGASCHSSRSPAEMLDLGTAEKAYLALVGVASKRCTTQSLVDPGSPSTSYLISKLVGSGACYYGGRMPPGAAPPTPAADLARLRSWIAAGAPNN